MTQPNDAAFWQMKYFELLGHMSQVIGHLGQPIMTQALIAKLGPRAQGHPVPGPPVPEPPEGDTQ